MDRGVLAPPSLAWGVSLDERKQQEEEEEEQEEEGEEEHLVKFITKFIIQTNR